MLGGNDRALAQARGWCFAALTALCRGQRVGIGPSPSISLSFSRVGASAAIEQTGGLKLTTYALWLISLILGRATVPFKTQLAAIERAFDNLFLHSA
jgi:hypothetical protein